MKSISTVFAVLLSVVMWAQVQVTFQVDMTGQNIHANGIHVAGGFQAWNPATTALTDQGNGLYSVTLDLAAGTYQYKFINGNDWPQAESVPASCGASDGFGGYNRTVTVPNAVAYAAPVVCFGTCAACAAVANPVSVTLQVDMSDQTVSPNGVHVAGSFQNWNPASTPMTAIGNGMYSYTFEVDENASISYKFINGNDWPQSELVPMACGLSDGFGGYNRTLAVEAADVVVPGVCFGECAACVNEPDPEMVQVTLRVNMSDVTVDANGVHVVGTFQNWTLPGESLIAVGNGVYEYAFDIAEGSTIDYKFLNGVDYTVAEQVPAVCGVDDGFGGINRRVVLTSLNDTIIPTVCFSSCENCVMPETIQLTLQVDMSDETVSPDGVYVAGPFNDWSANTTALTDTDADNVYTATVDVDANAQVFYKFINGNTWGNEEVVPAECSLSDGQGNFNRVVYTPANDTIVPQVCFASCEDCGTIVVEPSNMITFQVNMVDQIVSPNGVHITGNFNNWNPSQDEMLDANNDGVYSITLEIDEWANISFKFINGNDFSGVEVVPSSCGLPDGVGGYNRLLETGTIDYTFGPVCFGTCTICLPIAPPVLVDLTLQVNMQNETVSPNGVHVAGSFQGWNPDTTELTDVDADGIYEVVVAVEANTEAQFKFINGNTWGDNESVPMACGISNEMNRFINVLNSDTLYGPVCFGECLDCEPIIVDPILVDLTLQVNMQNETVSPNGVHVAGSFQGWNPSTTELTDVDADGIYEVVVAVEANTEAQFKFINGNTWGDNESVPAACGITNEMNRFINVLNSDTLYGPVCFGECVDCEPIIVDPILVDLTLQVNMQNETVSPNGVHVAGSFQGWNPATTELTDVDADGIYEVVVAVEANTEAQFKFINGNTWSDNESVPAACGISNEMNRFINVLNSDTLYGPVCFGECLDCDDIVLPTLVNVTFMVNMQNEVVHVNGVHLAGNIQSWNPAATAMTDDNGDGVYEVTLEAPINSEVVFKFINGNTWAGEETVPMECGLSNGFGGYNRSFNVGDVAASFGPVCFDACLDCLPVLDSVQIAFRVDMTNEVVSAEGVFFQSPDAMSPSAMTALGNGIYEYIGLFEIGSVIEYLFVNGSANESLPASCSVDVGVNGMMREYTVGNFTQVVGPVCFSSCEACPIVEPEMVALTLSVDMSNETVSANGVHVAGTFNNWNPSATALTDDNADGIYIIDVMVPVNSTIDFKFINGNDWGADEVVTGPCAVGVDGNRQVEVDAAALSYGPFCFGSCAACGIVVEPTLVTVVFQVNMSNEVVSPNGVHIAGNFQGWNPNGTVMNALGGGIYELSYEVETNQTLKFKFINGSDWANQELVPSDCGVDNGFGGFDRELVVGEENLVFGPVCFNGCVDCDDVVEPTTVEVTFIVDMTNEVVSPNGVHIAGNFQGWNPASTAMTDSNADGLFEYTATVSVDSEILFKFINGDAWPASEVVPADCGQGDGFGGYNRLLNVMDNDTTYGPVCFGGCAACASGMPVLVTLRVNMANETVSADGVFVAGDFNTWDPTATQMSEYAPDLYEAVVVVMAGETVQYKFLNGMEWTGSEVVPSDCGVDDGSGNMNRSYVVGEVNATLPVVCFSGCADCMVNPEIDVTFQVNMADQVVEPAGVFVAGSFNGFNPTAAEMTLSGPSTYTYTITVPVNALVTYKFLNGATWEVVPFECGQDDGFGGFNRYLQGGTSDVTLSMVCFNECADCDIAVDDLSSSAIEMYPNPSAEFVVLNGMTPGEDIRIYSVDGQLMDVIRAEGHIQSIDVRQLAAGIYSVQIGDVVKKLIKQ